MGVPVSKRKTQTEVEVDNTSFIYDYVEFHLALAEFLDKKQLRWFERQLTKGGKFVEEFLGEIVVNVAHWELTDLHVFRERKEPNFLELVDDAIETHQAANDLFGYWQELQWHFGKPDKVAKKFVQLRREIRKEIRAQLKAAALAAELAAEHDVPEFTIDVEPGGKLLKVNFNGESEVDGSGVEFDFAVPPAVTDVELPAEPVAEAAPAP